VITAVTVKLAPAEMVYVYWPRVVEAFEAVRVRRITSPAAIFVFAIVTVPRTRVPKPIELVAANAAPLICSIFPAVPIARFPPTTFTLPDPEFMVVVEVVSVEPSVTVEAPAPFPIVIVFTPAPSPMWIVFPPVPVDKFSVFAPLPIPTFTVFVPEEFPRVIAAV